MNRIVVDDALKARLDGLQEPLTLCDENGAILAYVTPKADPSIYANLDPQVSEEELTRREQEGGGRSLAEIIADLENNSSRE